MASGKEEELWIAWLESNSTHNLHSLIEHYQEWLVSLTRSFYIKYYLSSYEIGDYLHWGTIGLIESIKRYTPVHGVKFQSYAYKRIKGEIINQLNKGSEKIAQNLFMKNNAAQERIDYLIEHTISDSVFEKLCSVTINIMIGNMLDCELELYSDNDNLLDGVYGEQQSINLVSHLNQLPENQKLILMYHYFNHLQFSEICELMKLTKGRVSQLYTQAISNLKEMLSASELELYL